jgi:hypothetical protein
MMMLTYIDNMGMRRVKRRYVWGLWGFVGGFVVAAMLFGTF